MPSHGAVTAGPDVATAVMYAVLLERACRTQLMALAAGDVKAWSDADEAALKREQVWNRDQVHAGYGYLVRKADRGLAPSGTSIRVLDQGTRETL
jgi:ribulose-5-phosphate 4-epimerase/fuculose-1-phosphate aldolase